MKLAIDGAALAWEEAGAGLPVVFLHGFPHNRSLWTPQLRLLAGRYRCIAPDLRGFGESSVRGPWSMDRYADDVVALLDALDVGRAVIAGLSMGGYVAFAIWRRHPERVRALVLADTRAGADDDDGRARRRALMDLARTGGAAAVADAMMDGMVGRTTRRRCPELVASVRAMLAAASVEGITGALQAMLDRPDSTPTMATITVPTLFVVGEEDALTPLSESRAMHAATALSRLAIIPGAGHVSAFERPAAFSAAATDFLSVLPGG